MQILTLLLFKNKYLSRGCYQYFITIQFCNYQSVIDFVQIYTQATFV